MRVLVYAPDATRGVEQEIDGSLESLQAIVGGHIEFVRATPDIGLILNEEGLLLDLPPNKCGASWSFVGPMFAVRIEGPEFVSLTDEDIALVRSQLDQQ